MTSVIGRTARADRPFPRSSVASKRFPLSNVRSARFSLCAGFLRQAGPAGRGSPNRICGAIVLGSARTLKGEGQDADDQPADTKSAGGPEVPQEGAGAAAVA